MTLVLNIYAFTSTLDWPCLSGVESFKPLKQTQTQYAAWRLLCFAKTMISCDLEENLSYLNTVLQSGMEEARGLQRF